MQDVYSAQNYNQFKQFLEKSSRFAQYLNFQMRKWQIIYHSGMIQLTNQDMLNDKLIVVDI